MIKQNTLARLTGLVYLILILTGIYALYYVPSQLINWQSSADTAKNILKNEFTFRLAITAEIISFTCFIILPLLFYKLLHKVDNNWAVAMVAFSVLSVPITIGHVAKHIDVLTILKGQPYLRALSKDWLESLVMMNLAGFNNGTVVTNIFWGLWLFPLGVLVYKSNILPKLLGIFLMLGCIGCLVEFVASFLFTIPEIPWYVSAPTSIAEFGICLWLIVFGAKPSFFRIKA